MDVGGSVGFPAGGTIVFAKRAEGATAFLGLVERIGELLRRLRMILKPVCKRSKGFSGGIASFLFLVSF